MLEPFDLPRATYGSAALNFLLHCVPGDLATKAIAFDHVSACLRPGGVLFGSTILGSGVPTNPAGRFVMNAYNKKGIFHNRADTLEDLETELGRRFDDYIVRAEGCVALFEATVP